MNKLFLLLAMLSNPPADAPVQFQNLRFRLPATWKAVPPQALEQGATAQAWAAPDGRYLQLDYWPGLPPSPGGPMRAAQRWPVQVAGRSAELVQADYFRGRPDEILLVMLATGPQYYRLFSRHESRSSLTAILHTMSWAAGTSPTTPR